jgi:Leucine-rich repeat (LRR) protein
LLYIDGNKFTELPKIQLPKLEFLDISDNKLEKHENFAGHPTLKVLKSNDNKFKNLNPFKEMPNLTELYLEWNPVANFTGYENIPNLKRLYLKKAKLEKFPDEEGLQVLENLEYLDLEGNKISTYAELFKLFAFPALLDINLASNPLVKHATSFNLVMAEVLIQKP